MDQPHLVKSLLQESKSVDINHKNSLGLTALHYAAQQESIECVKLLVAVKGIKPNIQDNIDKNTPLHTALINCTSSETALEIARLLISVGADPRIVNKDKQRPVNLTEPEEEEIRTLLLQATLAIQVKDELAEQLEEEGEQQVYYSSD
ncbi:hypothetical protein LPJ64_005830 [Coemansia asiatica]|uniref:Ankyrin n=1 Tax=Coemansia asiatica TaxID=1052880 RepID=A0A9W7XGD0_9FUNG|nr:hypothetical protein LPJ64_005830 [Coemansia asiatica]